ncbi:MAG: dTDP-glucose 4,6-dehydratase, partial [Treponemataceae bacterium]|nr:dTDP-glucose 4,6-dehydratase [Treponemataceae bacterium]
MKRKLHTILVTGGAGFIGSNFIHYLFGKSTSGAAAFEDARFSGRIVNLDALTYAGNGESLDDIDAEFGTGARGERRYFFEKADICDRAAVERIFRQYDIDTVVHFAAESHVDRSIVGPEAFVRTNVLGTYTLLDVARTYWGISLDNPRDDVLFHHISTDEVYGSLGPTGYFTETTPYDPRSPYSASKASSDHIVMAYHHTYGLPVTLSNCTNNYGPFQFPEKLIPLMILNMQQGKSLPVYGAGTNIRDWIYGEDHNRAVWLILQNGTAGEKYNIGGENEWQNITLLEKLIETAAPELGKSADDIRKTIT